jgi:hypothetical protein
VFDFVGTIVITVVMVVCINAVVSSLPVSRFQRIGVAVAVGLWIGLAAASATKGLFTVAQPFPYIGLFIASPLVAIAALVTISLADLVLGRAEL